MNDAPVIIGEINGVYGVKGWVKVFSHTQPRSNIVNYDPWLLKAQGDWNKVKVISGRAQGKTIVAQLEGVTDVEQAKALIGTVVGIDASQMKALDNNDYYWRDLEGLDVINLQGESMGKVSHLIETGANDVMVVNVSPEKRLNDAKGKAIKETMIPYIDEVVKEVDLEQNLIKVDWDDEYL